MRTSSGTPPQNGCVLTSSRPASKSKPSCASPARTAHAARPPGTGPTGCSSGSAACLSRTRRIKAGSHAAQVAEDAVELRAGHAGFVAVHQRVVAGQAAQVRQQRGLLARQRQHRAEVLQEALASRPPGAAGARRARSAPWPAPGAPPATPAARWRAATGGASRAGWHAAPRPAARRRPFEPLFSAGSVRMRCSSAAISAIAAARASLPFAGMWAAWSQPAIDCRWPRRCNRVQVPVSRS
jgi:hypothetical protein